MADGVACCLFSFLGLSGCHYVTGRRLGNSKQLPEMHHTNYYLFNTNIEISVEPGIVAMSNWPPKKLAKRHSFPVFPCFYALLPIFSRPLWITV